MNTIRMTCAALAVFACALAEAAPKLEEMQLPEGFRVDLFADGIDNARSLALGSKGTVFVGTRTAGNVHALRDEDGDGRAERRLVIARGLDTPNGVAVLGEDLYVAEHRRIVRFPAIETRLAEPSDPVVVYDGLPKETHHGWRYLGAGPDGWLYVAVGVPCNICLRPGYGVIDRLRPDGSEFQAYAEGIRNSIGFDWHPVSGALWFTDNGRDWLGDDSPPDELNHAPRAGMHFGFPFCHGGDLPDPEFGKQRPCNDFVPPARHLGAHVAALGMRFYDGAMFPPEYRNQLFVAEHGSWNRSEKSGYRISLLRFEGDKVVSYEPFATGFLNRGGGVDGRPVDLLVMPDGALLISDDHAGAIYRVSYSKPNR